MSEYNYKNNSKKTLTFQNSPIHFHNFKYQPTLAIPLNVHDKSFFCS